MNSEQLKDTVIDALEDIKAQDLAVLPVRHLTSLTDYMVIATGTSNRHLRSLANEVQEKVKAAGGEVLGVEGEQAGEWVLIDLGDVVVHVMQAQVRDYYNIDELWGGDASRVARQLRGSGTGSESGADGAGTAPAPRSGRAGPLPGLPARNG
ncbi:MAG: ribosome silencing factor [Rhodocyclaceae bacterium]|nr:ribosome silencing factor [Rhodocyclaceae bacterium]